MAKNTTTLIPVNLVSLAQAIFWYISCKVKYPVLVAGRHGIAKSQAFEQLAKHLSLPYINRRASQDTEGDLGGMPDIGKIGKDKVTNFVPLEWLHRACHEGCLVHIDEIDRSVMEVAQGYFQLADSRQIRGNKLHDESLIVSCINGGNEHGKNYRGIRPMGPAEFSRWGIFNLTFSQSVWLDWANGKDVFADAFASMPKMPTGKKYNKYVKDNNGERLHSILQNFIVEHPSFAMAEGDLADNTVYPTPRSWSRCSQIITPILYIWENKKGKIAADLKNTLQLIVQSQVGMAASIRLEKFMADYTFRITAEDILKGEKLDAVAELVKDPVKNQAQLSELTEEIFAYTSETQEGENEIRTYNYWENVDFDNEDPAIEKAMDEKIDNLRKFFRLIPAELKSALWKEHLCNIPMYYTSKFHGSEEGSETEEAKTLRDLGVLTEREK